jgi:hypothetical protein
MDQLSTIQVHLARRAVNLTVEAIKNRTYGLDSRCIVYEAVSAHWLFVCFFLGMGEHHQAQQYQAL